MSGSQSRSADDPQSKDGNGSVAGGGEKSLSGLLTSPKTGTAGQESCDPQMLLNQLLQTRRLSEVGASLSSKLGQAIGWQRRSSSSSSVGNNDQIVAQAKSLCGRYLRSRMRDAPAIFQKKLSFQRLKSVSNMAANEESLPDVLHELKILCKHLEVSNPELYGSLVDNVGLRNLPSSERGVKSLLTSVVSELFSTGEMSWGRLAAMFAVTGALALDCVRANKPELVLGLVETTGRNIDCHAACWIAQQGGWEALTGCFRNKPGYSGLTIASMVLVIIICSFLGVLAAHALFIRQEIRQMFFPAVS